MDSSKEIWVPIIGYEDAYMISNTGIVKSLERTVRYKEKYRTIPEKIKHINISKKGYCYMPLYYKSKLKNCQLHRLVAIHFIPNTKNKPCVNHKNGIKSDNRVENLEWVTFSENEKHSYSVLGKKANTTGLGRSGALHFRSKKVICCNFDVVFDSSHIAASKLGLFQSAISLVCLGKQKQTQGFTFRYLQ